MASAIRLVAGLGNPGLRYEATRHNAGFWFANALAHKLGVRFSMQNKFAAEVARAGEVRIAKPMTYMNESGRCVAALTRFFNLASEEILVVHDELDLKPGDAKLKLGGGHAGHNGLRDIHAALGTADFWRLRLGIGHPRESQLTQQQVHDYVLKPAPATERRDIGDAIDRALAVWPAIASGDMERAMLDLHSQRPPAK